MTHGWDTPEHCSPAAPCALTPTSWGGRGDNAHPDLQPYPANALAALACTCDAASLDPAAAYR